MVQSRVRNLKDRGWEAGSRKEVAGMLDLSSRCVTDYFQK